MSERSCRICGGRGLQPFLDLGKQPCANAFLREADLARPERRYPLGLCVCPDCQLIQLTHVVPAAELFTDYVYFSSISGAMATHFSALAHEVVERYVPPDGLVVEIGSNDGILLANLVNDAVRILGVDPAETVAEKARARGVPTVVAFFNAETASAIRSAHGGASAIVGNNVLAHIDDLHDTMRGIDALLLDDGALVFEVPYVVDMLAQNEFDTVYHEHVSYFGLHPLQRLLEPYGFEMVEVRRVNVHGGSVRITARRRGVQPRDASVDALLEQEAAAQISDATRLTEFAEHVRALRTDLLDLIDGLRRDGHRVVGYTAPAKGNVLLNYCGIGPDRLDWLADATPAKQGRWSPGMRIPVVCPQRLHDDAPTYALLLAWNHREEVLRRERQWREDGGRFIIPLPRIEVV